MHIFMQNRGFYARAPPLAHIARPYHMPLFPIKKRKAKMFALVKSERAYYTFSVKGDTVMDEKDKMAQDSAAPEELGIPTSLPLPDAEEGKSTEGEAAETMTEIAADDSAVLADGAEAAESADGAAVAVMPQSALRRAGNTALNFIKSVLGLGQKGDMVPGGEKISYYTYFAGQNLIYTLVASFLTTFAVMQGMDPEKVALVMLAVKIWDAFNDAIFGALFDKIKFKSGNKFMPWLKMSVVAIPLSVIFLFAIPAGLSEAGKLAWLAVAYLVHDCVYTLCDAPIHGCVTVLTDNFGEREKMLSVKGICGTAGSGIASLLAMLLVSQAVGISYFYVAIIGSAIALVIMLPFCFKGKERSTIPPPEESFTIRRMFKYLFSNKYLLIYYFAFLFSSGCSVLGSLQVFMSYYIFNDELVVLYTGFITTVPFAVASFGVPYLLKKINKITLYKFCLMCTVVFNLLIFFFAKGNAGAYMGLSVLTAVSTGVTGVLLFMFTPDCAEYGRFKTGIDAKGITFSLQTLMAKATSAIAGSLGLAIIGLFGWHTIQASSFAELAAQGVTQPDSAINGLWIACILVPAIGNFIAVCILQLYRLKDSDVKLMMRCNAGEISREEALAGITCRL